MLRHLFLILLFLFSSANACTLCAFYTPTADVSVRFESEEATLKRLYVSWEFSERFTGEILKSHDLNRNGTLEPEELANTQRAFYDYLKPNNFLTELTLGTDSGKERNLSAELLSWEFRFVDNRPRLDYILALDAPLGHETSLGIVFWDEGKYFDFMIKSTKLTLPPAWHIEQQVGPKRIDYYIYDRNRFIADSIDTPADSPMRVPASAVQEKNPLIGLLETVLKQLSGTINGYIDTINKEGDLLSYLWLLLFSLIYGIIHAAGPGHGKSLVASYFLAHDHSYSKAYGIAAMIAVVHTFSAFSATLIIYFVLDMFFSQFFTDLTYFTTKVSAVLIIAVAFYLLYKKRPLKKGKKWHTHPPECSCGGCRSDPGTTELGLIISAGIIPCPGTVTIFMLTLSLGEYFVGFLSALFMSIGMSLVILVAAVLSIGVRRRATARFTWLRTVLDYGSLLFIMLLGVTLFFVEM